MSDRRGSWKEELGFTNSQAFRRWNAISGGRAVSPGPALPKQFYLKILLL